MNKKWTRSEAVKTQTTKRRGACLPTRRLFAPILLLLLVFVLTAGTASAYVPGERASLPAVGKPIVTVEGNATIVRANPNPAKENLDGFFEISVKVQTHTYYNKATGKMATAEEFAADKVNIVEFNAPFDAVDVALMYDATVFTPVTTSATAKETFNADGSIKPNAPGVVKLTPDRAVSIPAAGPSSNILASAKATLVKGATANDHDTGLLTMSAMGFTEGVKMENETAVVTVRFAYNAKTHPMLATNAVDQRVCVQGTDKVVTDTSTNPADKWGTVNKHSVLWFATDAVAANSAAHQSVWYSAKTAAPDHTELYYYQGADTDTFATNTSVTTETGTYTVGKPATVGKAVLSQNPASAPASDPNFKDNRLSKTGGSVVFKLVNSASTISGSGTGVGGISIIFLDWDSALLGSAVVAADGDVRETVNTYVRDHLVHPFLRAETPGTPDYANLTDSLDRQYTYRGKYPANVSTGATVTDGEQFPLTNKLDYAFYRRPTTQYKDGAGNVYNAVLPVSTTTENGANRYPYVYGWALVKDVKGSADVWTTFDAGELSGLNPAYDQVKDGAQTYTPSVPAGDPTPQPIPYAYKTSKSTNSDYLEFVDFSNLTPYTADTTTLVVKAVYEPGTSLLDQSYNYTLTKMPTYTRANTVDSTKNAAYNISFAYSRLTTYTDATVRGVARAREPGVRVKVTPDKLAGGGTTNEGAPYFFQRTMVENTEVVEADIFTAASVYALDYTLVDQYSLNLIAGQARSMDNAGQAKQIAQNFTYRGTADDYANRLGTPGFVFDATIGVLMDEGTKKAQNLSNKYSDHMTYQTALDLNIHDEYGNVFTAGAFVTQDTANTIARAVAEAWAKHDPQFLNAEGTMVDLDYHQIQQYILDGTLLSDEQAKPTVKNYAWCRQHKECLELGAGTASDWPTLLEAAKNYATNPAPIDKLVVGSISGAPFYLKNSLEQPYTDAKTFGNDMKQAVAAAGVDYKALTWDSVQYYIINKTFPTDGSTDHYEWYGGGSAVTGWDSLLAATETATLGILGPEAAEPQKKEAALNTAETNYKTLSYTLASDTNGTQYLDFASFKAAFKAAYLAAPAGTSPDWNQIQYYILHPGAFPTKEVAKAEANAQYWWYNGGTKVKDLASLLKAAYNVYVDPNNVAMLNSLTLATLESGDLYLRSDFKGTKFVADADPAPAVPAPGSLSYLKEQLKALVGSAMDYTALTWNQVQYYLIHNELPVPLGYADIEGDNYWWKNGGAGTAVVQKSDVRGNVDTLIETAYRASINGNIHAWDNVNAPAAVAAFRLVQADNQQTEFIKLDQYEQSELDVFKKEVEDFVTAGIDRAGEATAAVPKVPQGVTWYQLQKYLFTKIYLDATDPALPGSAEYWWLNKDSNAVTLTPKEEFDAFLGLVVAAYKEGGGKTPQDLNNALTLEFFNQMKWNLTTTSPITTENIENAKYRIGNLWKTANKLYYNTVTGKLELSWHQVQFFIIKGGMPPHSIAIKQPYTWAPSWASETVVLALSAEALSLSRDQWTAEDWNLLISDLAAQLSADPTSAALMAELTDAVARRDALLAAQKNPPAGAETAPTPLPPEGPLDPPADDIPLVTVRFRQAPRRNYNRFKAPVPVYMRYDDPRPNKEELS